MTKMADWAEEEKDKIRTLDPRSAVRIPKARASSLKHKTRFPTESVKQSEESLRQLLDDFEQGRLTAFGNSDMVQKMNDIRKMQEELTVKHFEIDQTKMAPETASGTAIGEDNQLAELTKALEKLGSSIQSLHTKQPDRKPRDNSKHVSLKVDLND